MKYIEMHWNTTCCHVADDSPGTPLHPLVQITSFFQLEEVKGREILDSRGNPTVEACGSRFCWCLFDLSWCVQCIFYSLTGGMNRLNGWMNWWALELNTFAANLRSNMIVWPQRLFWGPKLSHRLQPPSRLQFLESQSSAVDGRLLEASGWKQSNFGWVTLSNIIHVVMTCFVHLTNSME